MKSKAGTRAALVALLALIGVAGAVATADATTPGTNGKIASSLAASSPRPGTLSSPLPVPCCSRARKEATTGRRSSSRKEVASGV